MLHEQAYKSRNPFANRVFLALLDVLHLLAHLFDFALEPHGYPRKRRALRLRAHRVDLAIDLLQQKLDLLAHRPLAFHQLAQTVQMGPQASHFLGDVGSLGGIGGLLVQPLLVDRQIGDKVSQPSLKIRHNFAARGLRQPLDLRHGLGKRVDAADEVGAQRFALALAVGLERLERASDRSKRQLHPGAGISLFFADLENLWAMQQDLDLRFAGKTEAAPKPAKLLDVERREPVVDAQRRRRRAKRRASDKKLDPAARYHALNELANFGLVFSPGAGQIELELEKPLIERAYLCRNAHLAAFDLSPSEAGHTAHLAFVPRGALGRFPSLKTSPIKLNRPPSHRSHREALDRHSPRR